MASEQCTTGILASRRVSESSKNDFNVARGNTHFRLDNGEKAARSTM